jgi:outer membrane protein assembly factor BamA
LPEGKYLLSKNEVKIVNDEKGVSKRNMTPYLRQQENNRSLFGTKLHLCLYNLSPRCDSCWLGTTLRKLGEPPVVFDPELVELTVAGMQQYLRSRGYYHAEVDDTVRYRKKKATVIYRVRPGHTFTLQNIAWQLTDELPATFILSDTANTLLRPGAVLSVKLLEQERERIELFLRNKGFYLFSRALISYEADTLIGHGKANLTVFLNKNEASATTDSLPYNRRYRIRDVKIYTHYDALEASTRADYLTEYREASEKTYEPAGAVYVLHRRKPAIRRQVLLNANTIEPGRYYSEQEIMQTYTNFSNLRLFRIVSIGFDTVRTAGGEALLDCAIRLTDNIPQGFKMNIEASSSSLGLLGLSPTISYYHQNLFRGAEGLNVTFSDNYQFDLFRIGNTTRRSNELSASVSVSMPKFFLPRINRYFKTYSPRTDFTMSYGHQLRPEYTRNSMAFLFGYSWRPNAQLSYSVNLLNLSMVKLYNMSDNFFHSTLRDPYLRNRYEDHFVMGTNASFQYSTRQAFKTASSVQFRWNIGFAGNLLSAFNRRFPTNANRHYLVWGTPYSQYAKTDINLSYYQVFDARQTLAYRVFAGIGRAYGNSISMPYEEVYYSGGAYSLRGWQSRSIGPGAAPVDTTFVIPNQVGDLKLEANIEYRFKMVGVLDGALFLDAGNIWSLNYKQSDKLAVFDVATFYRQIALNTGFGLRLNFDFLVIRLDIGAKLHDPQLYRGWVPVHNVFSMHNLSWHFGIGYPF